MSTPAKLTEKQRRFVAAYMGRAKGNATRAAKLAGYKGNDHTLAVVGQENLTKPAVRAALDALVAKVKAAEGLSVAECQKELARIVRAKKTAPKDKISAIDKVLKTHGAYLDKVEHSGSVGLEIALTPEQDAALVQWLELREDEVIKARIAELRGDA